MTLIALAFLLLTGTLDASQAGSSRSWLDRPLAGWNKAGALVPATATPGESRDQILKRCGLELRRATAADRALADAGLIPMTHLTRVLVRDDVEIVDGVVGMDEGCEPASFNTFVFVGGRFAGTLSPTAMAPRRDGAAGAIRIISADEITVDFLRYGPADTECCPAAHVKARFRINRTQTPPVVEPADLQTTR